MTTSRDRAWWHPLSERCHQVAALLAMALGPLVLLALLATPVQAAATGSAPTVPFADPDPGPAAIAMRLLLLTASSIVVGAGLSRLLVPLSTVPATARRVVSVAAAFAAAAAVASALLGQADPWLATGQVIITVIVAAVLPSASFVAPAALALLVLLAVEFTASSTGLAAVFEVSYAVGAALVSGSSILVATGMGDEDANSPACRVAAPRLVRISVGAGLLITEAGLAHAVFAGPYTSIDLLHTSYGAATLVALLLPLAVTGVWAWAARDRVRLAVAGRIAVVGVTIAIGTVGMLATLPVPAAAPVPGQSVLRPVNLAGQRLALLVTPALPGRNLVRLTGGPTMSMSMSGHDHHDMPAPLMISAGGAPVSIIGRPGASGSWAVLDIPAGTRQITVSQGESSTPVPIDVGTEMGTTVQQAMQAALTGPDGPECADAVLGALLVDYTTAQPTTCPSQRLDPADAEPLRVVVDFLADRGVQTLTLVGDDSPRSVAAAAAVQTEATRRHLTVSSASQTTSDALVVVSGWATAVDSLCNITQRAASSPTATGGIYLAPWLLAGNVINVTSSVVLPLRFNPQEVGPHQYAATLASVFADSVPSQAGYTSWEQATHSIADHKVTLYGAAPVNVPMGMAMDMDAKPGQWFPGGAIVPISLPLSGP